MSNGINEEFTTLLYKAITTLQTPEEVAMFFKDLCTKPEIRAMSQRFAVASLLKENCVYSDIVARTGASTATISRVNRSLVYEDCGGYDLVFSRMKDDE